MKISNFGIILYPSTRSLAYLHMLSKNNIMPKEVIVMGKWPFLPENIFNLQSKINNFLFKLYKIRNNKIIFQKIKKIPRNLNGKITYSNLPN